MKNQYIKIDIDNNIIDLFEERQNKKFDGTEIFFKEVEDNAKLKINDMSISNSQGAPLFHYDSTTGVVTERTTTDIDSDLITIQGKINTLIKNLEATDVDMSRITEDVIEALDANNTLKKDDLPADALTKINLRQSIRDEIAALQLLLP